MNNKVICVFLIGVASMIVLSGCSILSNHEKKGDERDNICEEVPYQYAFGTEDEMLDFVFEKYSISQIIDMKYYYLSDLLEELGVPNALLFVDELLTQGYYSEVEELISMAEIIGYYPSIVFGNYVADRNNVIHNTNGECFNDIPIEELMVVGAFPSVDAINNEICDNDYFLDGYTVCPFCCN